MNKNLGWQVAGSNSVAGKDFFRAESPFKNTFFLAICKHDISNCDR